MVHIVGCRKDVTSHDYAKIFKDNVSWLHDVLKVMISNQDPCFTNKLLKALFDLLDVDTWFSIGFDPQTYA